MMFDGTVKLHESDVISAVWFYIVTLLFISVQCGIKGGGIKGWHFVSYFQSENANVVGVTFH